MNRLPNVAAARPPFRFVSVALGATFPAPPRGAADVPAADAAAAEPPAARASFTSAREACVRLGAAFTRALPRLHDDATAACAEVVPSARAGVPLRVVWSRCVPSGPAGRVEFEVTANPGPLTLTRLAPMPAPAGCRAFRGRLRDEDGDDETAFVLLGSWAAVPGREPGVSPVVDPARDLAAVQSILVRVRAEMSRLPALVDALDVPALAALLHV